MPQRKAHSTTTSRTTATNNHPTKVTWFNYEEAAAHCSWSVAHLRNLVSAGCIPVYGPPRRRRFRQDMLDMYMQDPAASMRKFRKEK